MKRITALAVGVVLLGAAAPAMAGPAPDRFATFEECSVVAAAVTSKAWMASCVPTSDGWTIVYTHKRKLS
jgi:uncharacterized low-complexity protein